MKIGNLYNKLIEYSSNGRYPFHMPGHKRNERFLNEKDAFDIDITEIDKFDNLHHCNGIIKEAMDSASNFFNTDKTYFLVNGSTSGILAAIYGTTNIQDKIIIGRNSHKSVYNAANIRNLDIKYLYPEYVQEEMINGGYSPKELQKILKDNPDTKVVVITSPTYEGVVSDIKEISKVVHQSGGVLIVDEAHGAHFGLSDKLPKPAYLMGADIVIESTHKTLPALTQTGLLHIKGDRVNKEKIEEALSIFETSSPSYVLMASIDKCIYEIEQHGVEKIEELLTINKRFREKVNNLKNIHVLGREVISKYYIEDIDLTKLVIFVDEKVCSGEKLSSILRKKYNFEMEMVGYNYVLGITTISDKFEEISRLGKALEEIDNDIEKDRKLGGKQIKGIFNTNLLKNKCKYSIYKTGQREVEDIKLEDSQGRISAQFIYLYPPGIPLIVPGEIISNELLHQIRKYKELDMNIQGLKSNDKIIIVLKG